MNSRPKYINSLEKQLLQFPLPGPEAQQHSRQLIDAIVEEINHRNGRISFEQYMAMALSTPGLGYYTSGNRKFGTGGDFVTAPEISPLFSRCLARQCVPVLSNLKSHGEANILEFGAGSGVMAADILRELETLDALPGNYFIVEISAELKQRQLQTLQEKVPHLLRRVRWLDMLPQKGFCGVVLANEVLDAMPVHRFFKNGEHCGEYYVAWDKQQFIWQQGEFSNDTLAARVRALAQVLPQDYVSEINLAADAWVTTVGDMLERGVIFIIDYGFPHHEYYHPQRAAGTLMCHYRHRSHDNPFLFPGLQDITAHVDFSAVAEAGHHSGLEVAGYNSQAFFLLANGLEQFLTDADINGPDYLKLSQQVKTLTMPGEMGELFKVMALSKAFDQPLQGFQLQDLRSKL